MKLLSRVLSRIGWALATTSTSGDDPVEGLAESVATIIQWVANGIMVVGIALVVIQLIKAGINLSKADSADQASAAKKKIGYCIFGLVLIIGATVAVNVLKGTIVELFNKVNS